MVEFIYLNLKVFLIQLLVYFSEGILCSQLTESPKAAAWLLLCGVQAALLRRQTPGAAHNRAGRTWRAL